MELLIGMMLWVSQMIKEFLAKAEELGIDLETGYNPLNYIDDDEDDDDEDEEE